MKKEAEKAAREAKIFAAALSEAGIVSGAKPGGSPAVSEAGLASGPGSGAASPASIFLPPVPAGPMPNGLMGGCDPSMQWQQQQQQHIPDTPPS